VAVLPAYPALGRQVLGGGLWVHGRRLDRTEYFKDPLSPAKVWRPGDLFQGAPKAHVPLSAVAGGLGPLRRGLRRALASGARFVTFDCAEGVHVENIARACLAEGCRHFAGAADLGGALAARLLGPAKPAVRPKGLPWMLLAGSVSATTFGQLEAWRAEGRPWKARLNRDAAGGWREAGTKDKAALRKLLRREGALALSSLARRDDLRRWRATQTRLGRTAQRCAHEAMDALVRWGLAVAGGPSRCGWFVTGGHTLKALDDAAGFRRFRITGEVLPEVPLGLAEGPKESAWLCSKPGGFGPADCFTRFMEAHS
jgi:uncharacterized protein YgbK (DUF1537 family)